LIPEVLRRRIQARPFLRSRRIRASFRDHHDAGGIRLSHPVRHLHGVDADALLIGLGLGTVGPAPEHSAAAGEERRCNPHTMMTRQSQHSI